MLKPSRQVYLPGGIKPMPSTLPEHSVDNRRTRTALAFAPLHRFAFGVAIGSAAALSIALLTAAQLIIDPEGQLPLDLLAQFFYGYTESWPGALIGAAWGFFTGFIVGWFGAFVRNLAIASWIFLTRTRAQLAATRDFLDHI